MNNEVESGNEELYNSFEALIDEVDEIKDGYEYEATIDGYNPDDLNPNDAFGDGSDIVRDLDDLGMTVEISQMMVLLKHKLALYIKKIQVALSLILLVIK